MSDYLSLNVTPDDTKCAACRADLDPEYLHPQCDLRKDSTVPIARVNIYIRQKNDMNGRGTDNTSPYAM